jgi:hypothetical protein
MADRPHLVLDWTFDVPNYKLFINIADDLEYEAHEGGTLGYTKTFQGVKTNITPTDWESTEKFWISEHYGHIYGYFQPSLIEFDPARQRPHPTWGHMQDLKNGWSPDGEYIDHMQRRQILLEGNDMAFIYGGGAIDLFLTPDKGLTIYKRVPTQDVNYPEEMMQDPTAFWSEWPQACGMQPRTKGPRLSSYEELLEAGASQAIIDTCIAGEWALAPNPELQQWYIYPTK